ncbi:MAG: RNA polymerase sigma factor [Planctomycetota bacterium]
MSEEEFVELYSDAHQRLWTLAAAITGDQNTAEDIVQESAITALKKLDQFAEGTSFIAWMSQIVRFTALNFLKSARRRRESGLSVHSEAESEPRNSQSRDRSANLAVTLSGELVEGQSEFDDEVAAAIGSLDPERRACLLLRTVHQLGYDEISEIVGVPEGTAMSHVHRARTSMRKQLQTDPSGDESRELSS